jgi:hypothetical protein
MRSKRRATIERLVEAPSLRVGYLHEPLLEFADGRRHVDPKTGIVRFGPKTLRPGSRHPQHIRTGFIGTPDTIQKAGDWIDRASAGVRGAPERLEFPGFRKDRGFFSEIELSSDWNAPIFSNEIAELKKQKKRLERFNTAVAMLDDKLSILSRKDRPPEYVLIALPNDILAECQTVEVTTAEHGKVFRNFRRAVKAVAMKYRLPTQIILEKTSGVDLQVVDDEEREGDYPSDIAWDFFTAMYFKAGGFPWGPVGLTPGSCYLGVGFFRPLGSADPHVQSSLVQAFDEHGDGLVLRGQDFSWDADKNRTKSPHLSSDQAAWIVERTLAKYRDEMGQSPTRMVIHKTSRFWAAETEGFRSALEAKNLHYDLVALAPDDTVRLFPVNQYPPLRGTRFTVGDLDYIYTTGFQPDLQQFHANHVPSALRLADHIGGDTSRNRLLEEVLILSKMNWNCALMGGLMPITLNFARRVGDILREIQPDSQEPLANFKFYI